MLSSRVLRRVLLPIVVLAAVGVGAASVASAYVIPFLELRLTTDGSEQHNPSVSGTNVVYDDLRNGNSDIYLYDLASNTEKRLTTDGATQSNPAISGTKVVYTDYRNGNYDIYLYDLATDTEKRLTTNGATQAGPAISGTKVVYVDNRNGNYDIYLHDLATDTEKRLTTDAALQVAPAISGANVVYEDNRNGGDWDIYLGELAVPRISASAPSVIAYGGKATLKGTLGSVGGIPIEARGVVLETSVDGISWTPGPAALTNASGAFTLISPALTSARYLRANFEGDSFYLSAQSDAVLVKPKASVGTPVAPSTMSHTKTYTVYGNLRPRHTAGSSVGTLKCYRYASGKWALKKTFTVKAYNYSSYSRYRAKVKLPTTGKWRMRMYHSDAGHAATYSRWRYVTVK